MSTEATVFLSQLTLDNPRDRADSAGTVTWRPSPLSFAYYRDILSSNLQVLKNEDWSPVNSARGGVDRNIWVEMTSFYSQGRPAYWPISLSTPKWIPDFNRKASLCTSNDLRAFRYLKSALKALIMLFLFSENLNGHLFSRESARGFWGDPQHGPPKLWQECHK